jgi:hypothetical protein
LIARVFQQSEKLRSNRTAKRVKQHAIYIQTVGVVSVGDWQLNTQRILQQGADGGYGLVSKFFFLWKLLLRRELFVGQS